MPRRRWLGFGLLVILLSSSGWLAAQPPRKEEEEEAKEKARPVVPVPVTEPDKKDRPPEGVDLDVGTFKEEAAKASHADARELFRFLSIPYDRLGANFAGGTTYRIELLPNRDLPDGELVVNVLDAALKSSRERKFPTGSGFKYTPFELIVIEEVDKFLAKKAAINADEKMEYAARALASGLRWHLIQVNNNKRIGKQWDLVGKQLRDRHLAMQRERFAKLVDAKQYDDADAVGLKMLGRYPENNDVRRDIYRLQLLRTAQSLKTPSDADFAKLREAVLLYERLPGIKDDGLIANSRKRLKDRANALVAEAQDLDKKKMTAAALAKLRQAELLDPDAPGLAAARVKLYGKVLYVGVAMLPEKMSPATARTDAERWATELMFEGLLQTIPDPDVIRYRPQLAEELPGVMPLGRSFELPRNARWSRDNGAPTDARDVRGTLDLLRRPVFRERWVGDGLDVFEEINRLDDPFKMRLAYRHGVLEPLSRATFKVLPAQFLQSQGKAADDEQFARAPFGSGPYRYEGRENEGIDMDGQPREVAVFRANPHYGQRAGKFGLPWIREIRLYVPTQSSLPNDTAGGQLHLYPDPPTDFAARFRNDAALKESMRVYPTSINRRIHILAINHRQGILQSDKLRQGLSMAINREGILKELFRPADDKGHTALTGPFPLRSWATPPTAKDAPLYKPGAGGLIVEGLAGARNARLRLMYVADDLKKGQPKNQQVCQRIKTQIEQATADKGGKAQVEIELVSASAQEFHERLHLGFDYDLALTTFDYRDDLYALGNFLDPEAAERGGRNYLGYLGPGTNPTDGDRRLRKLLDDVRQYRDFTKQVKDKTWDIHALFNQRVPFVPLWQFERYMIVHRDLEMYFDNPDAPVSPDRIDPAVVFTGIELWRLK